MGNTNVMWLCHLSLWLHLRDAVSVAGWVQLSVTEAKVRAIALLGIWQKYTFASGLGTNPASALIWAP